MITTEITILINRKSDINVIKRAIVSQRLQSPVYIIEYDNHYQINVSSDYEHWELDNAILACFPNYEFTSHLASGKKEIRLQLSRYQSEFSIDGWGRQIEDPLNETKYLVRKAEKRTINFNPEVKVLFGEEEQTYYINIVSGIKRSTQEQGFLILNDFKSKNREVEILEKKLYKTVEEALYSAIDKMKEVSEKDFHEHLTKKQKEKRAKEKLPRKIIRNFIVSCNKNDFENILNHLSDDFIFELKVSWRQKLICNGKQEFEQYIRSLNQNLCGQDFKIKSTWHFDASGAITVSIQYYELAENQDGSTKNYLRQSQLTFRIK